MSRRREWRPAPPRPTRMDPKLEAVLFVLLLGVLGALIVIGVRA